MEIFRFNMSALNPSLPIMRKLVKRELHPSEWLIFTTNYLVLRYTASSGYNFLGYASHKYETKVEWNKLINLTSNGGSPDIARNFCCKKSS